MNRVPRIIHFSRTASVAWGQNVYRTSNRQHYPVCADKNNLCGYQRVPALNTAPHYISCRHLCSSVTVLSEAEYEQLAEETLDSLSDMFEDLQENADCSPEYDVTFSSGVLTVFISDSWGTIVINKQTPNRQIWLSSPISGPKRYDYVDGVWVYKHDGSILHELLTKEVSEAIGQHIDFTNCIYGKR